MPLIGPDTLPVSAKPETLLIIFPYQAFQLLPAQWQTNSGKPLQQEADICPSRPVQLQTQLLRLVAQCQAEQLTDAGAFVFLHSHIYFRQIENTPPKHKVPGQRSDCFFWGLPPAPLAGGRYAPGLAIRSALRAFHPCAALAQCHRIASASSSFWLAPKSRPT